jgi:hypothetical protein
MLLRIVLSGCLSVFSIGLATADLAAAPQIGNLSLRGLQIGSTTTLAIDGTELGPEARLLLDLPVAKAELKPGGTANRVEFDVSLDAQVAPGIYLLRVASPSGISNAVLVGVDGLAQAPFVPELPQRPVALSGALAGSTVLTTGFAGKKGERVVVEVESRRLGAGLNPLLHLYDARHVQLAWSQGVATIAGDARIDVVLPADGHYTVELHDALFRGADPGLFRLKIGDLKYAGLVYPLAVTRGAAGALTFLASNLPAELRATLPAAAAEDIGTGPAPWPAGAAQVSGSRPKLIFSPAREIVEAPPGDKLQEITAAPVGINGRLSAKGEQDRYRIAVSPGQQLRFDVLASRAGSPLDGVLTISNEQGGQIAFSDDRPGTSDPGLDLTAPADAKALIVSLSDLEGRGGADFVYRIAVMPIGQPDFSVSASEDRWLVPQGGALVIRVKAERSGYQGPIRIGLHPQPAGLVAAGFEIPAGATEALLSLAAPGIEPSQVVGHLVARSTDPQVPLEHPLIVADSPALKFQPWLQSEVGLAITPAGPLAAGWDDFSPDTKLTLGATLPVHLRISRAAGVMGAVRIVLLTSQPMPKKTIKENNQDKVVDDVERSLRLQAPVLIAAGQPEAAAQILVPGDLATGEYDLAIKAELLSADEKNVVATAFAPARRLVTLSPVALELAGPAQGEGRAGAGTSGKFTGKIIRQPGVTAAVTVTLVGLPAGVAAPSVLVPPDKNDFELPLVFAFGTAAGDVAGVRLAATSPLDPQDAAKLLRTNEIPVALKIVAGEKPAAEPPLLVFEDQPEFVANLNSGAGQASLEANDKFSGAAAIRITPDQKYNEALPGLGVKIRENPGAGEFRYLQFAWRKMGGQSVCLQLNHDGQWGPAAGSAAKFRYHAGPGPECYQGSVAVSPTLPTGFTLVTRDLFADFGAFTLTGLALSPVDGEFAVYDHIYLGKSPADFDLVKP